jgi:hypothetical protein
MHTLALVLSIISSIIFIIYMLVALFASRQPQDNTITIKGSFVTRTIDTVGNSYTINRTIEHR